MWFYQNKSGSNSDTVRDYMFDKRLPCKYCVALNVTNYDNMIICSHAWPIMHDKEPKLCMPVYAVCVCLHARLIPVHGFTIGLNAILKQNMTEFLV